MSKHELESKLSELSIARDEKSQILELKNNEIEELRLKYVDTCKTVESLQKTVDDLNVRNQEIELSLKEKEDRLQNFTKSVEEEAVLIKLVSYLLLKKQNRLD